MFNVHLVAMWYNSNIRLFATSSISRWFRVAKHTYQPGMVVNKWFDKFDAFDIAKVVFAHPVGHAYSLGWAWPATSGSDMF